MCVGGKAFLKLGSNGVVSPNVTNEKSDSWPLRLIAVLLFASPKTIKKDQAGGWGVGGAVNCQEA